MLETIVKDTAPKHIVNYKGFLVGDDITYKLKKDLPDRIYSEWIIDMIDYGHDVLFVLHDYKFEKPKEVWFKSMNRKSNNDCVGRIYGSIAY